MTLIDKVKNKIKHKKSKDDVDETSAVEPSTSDNTVLSSGNAIAAQDPVSSDRLDTLDETIDPSKAPERLRQRLAEHQEQFTDPQGASKEAIEADLEAATARKAEYQREHRLPAEFDPATAHGEAKAETIAEPAALASVRDHEQFFESGITTKEDVQKDLDVHEQRRQAILDAKSEAAGREVLEAKKKAEEVNDGKRSDDGRDAQEQPGIVQTAVETVDSMLKTVGLK